MFVWLQNITNTTDDWNQEKKPYDMPLCRLVALQPEPLWNNSWLKKKIAANLPIDSIVDRNSLKETSQLISFNELWYYRPDKVFSSLVGALVLWNSGQSYEMKHDWHPREFDIAQKFSLSSDEGQGEGQSEC